MRFRIADESALTAPIAIHYRYETAAGEKTLRQVLRREDFKNGEAEFSVDAPGLTRCRSVSISY